MEPPRAPRAPRSALRGAGGAERQRPTRRPPLTTPAPLLRALTGQVDWWWSSTFRPRLAGLSDEEYLWEPADDCWSLHPAGDGLSRQDYHWPPPRPAPVTTIAWRMHHLGVGCLARRTTDYFPAAVPEPWEVEPYATVTTFPLTADGAVAFLDRWWGAWRGALGGLDEDALWRPIGDVEHDFAEMQLGVDDPFIGLVLHVHRELMHHGAEIGLLRDLYAAGQPKDAFVVAVLRADRDAVDALEADDATIVERYVEQHPDLVLRVAETARLDAVRLAVALGFDADDLTDGFTALHHAVGGGHLELIEALLDLGADPSVEDTRYHADALGWAEHFQQDGAAEFLRDR